MKAIFILFFVVLVIEYVKCAMTEAQIKSAGRMIRNVCQPKTKVTNAQIDAMHKGDFTENRDLMCYMECVLRMGQVMKEGKVNVDAVNAQLANIPADLAESSKAAVDKCKDSVKSSEKCAAAFEFYKCYYEFNPDKFFLP